VAVEALLDRARHAEDVALTEPASAPSPWDLAITLGFGDLPPFDNDTAKLERLSLQGRVLAPATRTILEMAGIESGMAVLDLGSGAGDVSFLAAEMVGPKGQVIGIDASADAVARAARRAQERNITNVRFAVGNIHSATPGSPFRRRHSPPGAHACLRTDCRRGRRDRPWVDEVELLGEELQPATRGPKKASALTAFFIGHLAG
jgi:SAM-dependent methyltransferase